MAHIYHDYTGATAGAALAANTYDHTSVLGTSPPVFEQIGDYMFLRFNAASGASSMADTLFPAAATQFSWAAHVIITSGASAAAEVWNGRTTGAGSVKMGNLLTGTADTMQFRQASDGVVTTSSALTEGVEYLFQIAVERGTTTSNGKLRFKITPAAGGTALVDYSNDARNLGTIDFVAARWGDFTTGTTLMNMAVGRVHIATGADALVSGALVLIDPYTLTFDPPANLTATAVSSTSISVDCDDVPTATSYDFQRRRKVDAGQFQEFLGQTTSSLVDTGLTGGTEYEYRVRAVK